MSEPRVVVTGHRNGVIWRYADRHWTAIGQVRKEQIGPCSWKAFASWDTYTEDTSRERVIRRFLQRIGVDPAEMTAECSATVDPPTDTRDRTTGAPAGAEGTETHCRSQVATTDRNARQ